MTVPASGGPISDERPGGIWSQPLTDSERSIIDRTVARLMETDPEAGRWFNFLVRVYNARSALLSKQEEALRRIADDFYYHYEGDPTSIARAALEGTQE